MAGDMNHALLLAQSICWDEGYGYKLGGNASSHSGGVDCGGLVFHCLHAAGYTSIPDTSPGVRWMAGYLSAAGFVSMPYSGNLSDLQHGDIVTCLHYNSGGSLEHGHTFFLAQDITAYVNGASGHNYCDGTTGICSYAKVEASYDWDPDPGDQDNGLGCHPEVWCHAFGSLYDTERYTQSDITIWRDPNYHPGGDEDGERALAALYLLFQHVDRKKRRIF